MIDTHRQIFLSKSWEVKLEEYFQATVFFICLTTVKHVLSGRPHGMMTA